MLKDKLKFLMVTTFYPPYNFGGDGIFVYRLSNELARRGHEVHVLHCVDAYRLLKKEAMEGDFPAHDNISVHSLKSPWGFLSPLLTQQTGHAVLKRKTIASLISKIDFDVIHFHNVSLIGLDTLALGETIKVYTLHEYWLVCPMHNLWKFGKKICDKPNCISCQILGKRPVQWWRFTGMRDAASSHIDAFISPSLFTKNKHHELGMTARIEHIPNFLSSHETQNYTEPEQVFTSGRPYFLFVGRLEKIKGVQNLIGVFRKITACDLLIAGEGKYWHTLRQLAQNVPNIKFMGSLPYDQLRQLYRNALAVIVPSLWYEVFGLVVIEAFAMRTPVIVNNMGALPEMVNQSKGGLVYDNEAELLEHVEHILINPQLREQLAENGYQAYWKYWTEEHHIDQYYKLILDIAALKNVNRPAIEAIRQEVQEVVHGTA